MPSAAQSLGIPKETRDSLGRWSPSGADDYARAYRAAAAGVQTTVLKAVLGGDRRLDEDEVLDRIVQLPEYGMATTEQALEMKALLGEAVASFRGELSKAQACHGGEAMPLAGEDLPPAGVVSDARKSLSRKAGRSCRPRFVIVYSRQRKSAKLHKIAGCEWTRVTLNDMQEFESVTSSMYDSRCKLCWPPTSKQEDAVDEFSSSDLSEI